jgi:hypothetical protein
MCHCPTEGIYFVRISYSPLCIIYQKFVENIQEKCHSQNKRHDSNKGLLLGGGAIDTV